jgi:uncharacterized protein YcnI
MKKFTALFSLVSILSLISISPAFAHATVKPKETTVATSQVFTLSIPTEKDIPTISINIQIPSELESVRPHVKAGWHIDTKKENEKITEITWSQGSIPMDQKDEFLFSAKTPAKQTDLIWKVYQIYQDGTVQAWDQTPNTEAHNDDDSLSGPYAITNVVDDLKKNEAAQNDKNYQSIVIYAALFMSILAILLNIVRK